ncbi:hypothetical protein HG530_013176 [Fusarium avenaceum]|nr:hypothetical protein HG530_013176 [Fusarium avenaceum]
MSNTPEVKNPETFLKDPRFSQTFQLPADPSDGHESLQVKYADYGYHNPTSPQDEHVLLFFAPLCASRIFHCAKDDLAKKYRADKVIGFVNGTLGPVFAPSAGISQIFRSSARFGPGEAGESNADAALEESLESHFFSFVHSESIKGFSDELQFLMQKVEGVSGWGDWLDYDDLMPKLVEALKGAGKQLTVEVFYAEQDSLIGAPGGQGPQWLNSCWEGDIAKEVVTYKTNTVKGTDHDTIWSIRQGVPEENVYSKLYIPISITPLQLCCNIHMHSLDIRISRESSLAQLPSNTTLLHTTKRNSPVTVIAGVDPNHTRLNPLGDLMRSGQVRGEQSTTEAKLAIVG